MFADDFLNPLILIVFLLDKILKIIDNVLHFLPLSLEFFYTVI